MTVAHPVEGMAVIIQGMLEEMRVSLERVGIVSSSDGGAGLIERVGHLTAPVVDDTSAQPN